MTKKWRYRRFLVIRRSRAARFNWEWHNYNGIRYIQVSIADPKVHRWWATTIWFYTSLRPHRWSLLGWIPSSGPRPRPRRI